MKTKFYSKLLLLLVTSITIVSCKQGSKSGADTSTVEEITNQLTKVTLDNYVQAETDWNFLEQMKSTPINQWLHKPPVTMENQTIIRSNADVVYSLAAVDVSKGATFSIPKRENGAMQLMQLIDENHFTKAVVFAGESVTLAPKDLSSGNYIYILARTRISDDFKETKQAQESEPTEEAQSAEAQQLAEQLAKETEQKHQQLLNKVTDDPYMLLRNKMQLEYQKRNQDRRNVGVKKKW